MDWRAVVSGHSKEDNLFKLDYFTPLKVGEKLVADIEEDDLMQAKRAWINTPVGY